MIKEELKLIDNVESLIPSALRKEDVFQLFVELVKEFAEPIEARTERKFPGELVDVYGYDFSGAYQLLINYLRGSREGLNLVEILLDVECIRKYLPSKSFMSVSLSEEDREEFYSKYPKFILSRYSERGKTWYRWGNFCSYKDDSDVNRSTSYMIDLRTYKRYGYRSWIVKDGEKLPLVVWEDVSKDVEKVAEEVVEIRKPFVMRGFFTKGWNVGYGRFLTNHGARTRLFPLKIYHKYYDRYFEINSRVLNYGYDMFMELKFKEVREKGLRVNVAVYENVGGNMVVKKRVRDSFAGECLASGRNYFPLSMAYSRLYLQGYLYDKDVAVEWGRGFTFLDSYRYFRMPAFFVELWYRVWEKRNNRLWWKYAWETDKSKLNKLVRLLRDLTSVSDRVYLNTVTRRSLRADGSVTAGSGYVISSEQNL